MSISVDKCYELGEEVRSFIHDTLNECGRVNSCISTALDDEGVSHDFRRGTDGQISHEGESQPHQYLVIDGSEIDGVDGPVVFDGAVDQFNERNYENGDVDVCLGSEDELPEVGVFDSDSSGFDWYDV